MNAPALNLFASPQGAAPQGSAAPVDGRMFGVFDALLASLTGEAPDAEGQPAEAEKIDPATPDSTVQPQVVALFTPLAPVTQPAPAEGEAAPQTAAPTFAPATPPEAASVEAATPEAKAAAPVPAAQTAFAEVVAPEAPAAPIETTQAKTPEAAAAPATEAKPAATPQLQAQPQEPVQAQARTPPPAAPPPIVEIPLNPQLFAMASPAVQAQAAPPVATPIPATPAKTEAKPAKGEEKTAAVASAAQARPNAEAPAPTLGEETIELAGGDIPVPDAAPDPEAPPPAELKPSHTPAATAAPQASAALEAHAPAIPVRGSPETVAHLAAQILQKLDSQTTRFEIALDPLGLGHVDVSMEIGADGKLTASMAFDTPQAAAELRGRAGELRQALEQAGFELSRDSLSFDVAHQGHRERETPERNPRNARAFQAVMASDEDIAALPHAFDRRTSGVDVRI